MSWRPSLIAIPAIPLSLHLMTRRRLRKTKGKKAYAIPVAILTGRFRQSRRQAGEMLQERCGVSVSLGSIQNLCEETSEVLAVPYREAKEAMAHADMVHLDETGWKKKGKRRWLWVAVTGAVTVFLVSLI
jgi:transposase-like protein